jgi:hypothetical protein
LLEGQQPLGQLIDCDRTLISRQNVLNLAGLGRSLWVAKGAQPPGQAMGFLLGDHPLLERQLAGLERSHRRFDHRHPLLKRRLKPSRDRV